MKYHKFIVSTLAIGFIAAGAFVGAVWAAPTQADIDFCNQQAAMLSRSASGSTPGSSETRQPGQIGSGATRGPDQPAAQTNPSGSASSGTMGSRSSMPGSTGSGSTSSGTSTSPGVSSPSAESAPGM